MTPAGAVSTFVSSGLDGPEGLAFDAAGNLYVANSGSNTISKVTPAGAVTAVSPAAGSSVGGTNIVITGSNLFGARGSFSARPGNQRGNQLEHADHGHEPGGDGHGGRKGDRPRRHLADLVGRPVQLFVAHAHAVHSVQRKRGSIHDASVQLDGGQRRVFVRNPGGDQRGGPAYEPDLNQRRVERGLVRHAHVVVRLAKSGTSAGKTYYWEVHVCQRHPVRRRWSSVSFTTAAACLAAPALIGPGSGAFPGQPAPVTQPTFQWQTVPGTDQYALYIRQLNADGSQGPIVFNSQTEGVTIPGSSTMYVLPSGFLQNGGYYCWNMNSHNASGWSSAYSTPLYFNVAVSVASGRYNAAAAVAYAERYAYTVCSDGYFWKGEPGDPAFLGAGQLVPSGSGVDGGIGDDFAHFVSCCIGSEPHQAGGGLTVQHYAGGSSNAYGDCNAADLVNQLISSGLATEVSSLGDLVPGDIVAFLTNGAVTHVTLYLGNDTIAKHSSSDRAIDTVAPNPQVEEYIHIIGPPANLGQPTPSASLNGTTGVPTNPTFSWSQVPENDGYQVVVSTNPNDLPTAASQTSVQPANGFDVTVPANQTSYTWTAALTAGPMYYWAVHALSGVGNWLSGLWSSRASFVTEATEPTLTITPLAGVTYAPPIQAGATYSIQPGSGDLSDPLTMPELEAYVDLAGTYEARRARCSRGPRRSTMIHSRWPISTVAFMRTKR